jgi:tetratricopeptide (TPR) repeat protein
LDLLAPALPAQPCRVFFRANPVADSLIGFVFELTAEQAYLFRHAAVRDVAYSLQPPSERARLQGIAVKAIEDLFPGEALAPFVAALAGYCRLAREEGGSTGLIARERDYTRRAAEQAERTYDFDAAERRYLQLAEITDGADAEIALQAAGQACLSAGRFDRAEQCFNRVLDATDDVVIRSRALSGLGTAYKITGRIPKAEHAFAEAIQLQQRAGERELEAISLANLGLAYGVTGHMNEAETHLSRALAILRELGNTDRIPALLLNLAIVCKHTGRVEQAFEQFNEAMAMFRATSDLRGEGTALSNLGLLYHEQGRQDEARSLLEQAAAIHRQTNNLRSEAIALGNLALVYSATKRLDECEQAYLQAANINREIGNLASLAAVLGNLGILRDEQQRSAEAEELFKQALALHARSGNRRFQAMNRCDYARCLLNLGRINESRENWQHGIAVLREIGDEAEIARKTRAMEKACKAANVEPFE